MHWFWSAIGVVLVLFSVALMSTLGSSMEIRWTNGDGSVRVENRPLRRHERVLISIGLLGLGALGALLIVGGIPWTDARLPDEQILRLLGTCVVTLVFALGAVVAWSVAWARIRHGRPSEPFDGPHDGPHDDEVDGLDDVAVDAISRLLLSHPVTSVLLGGLLAGVAVFSTTQYRAAWRGDLDRLEGVLAWFQPVSALGGLVGLGEVALGLILLTAWLVIAMARGNETGAAVTFAASATYGIVALVAWPFGLHDEWLGIGRAVLSVL